MCFSGWSRTEAVYFYRLFSMKKIGIIGGLAWPSTIDYYRLICKKSNEHYHGQGVPAPTLPMVIESLNINETRSARGTDGDEASWEKYDHIFRETFIRLQNAGADFGMIASNTPHTRLHSIQRGLNLPIVSILDTTTATVGSMAGRRALILGTPVTMRSDVYPRVMEDAGITAIDLPTDNDIDVLHRLIDVDLYQGRVEGAAELIVEISQKYIQDASTDIVCLACTELPLAFSSFKDDAYFEYAGLRFVNTIAAHVNAALELAISDYTSGVG